MTDTVIVAGARTPIGRAHKGSLVGVEINEAFCAVAVAAKGPTVTAGNAAGLNDGATANDPTVTTSSSELL
jgi:acetyl-CoA acetyltransferase